MKALHMVSYILLWIGGLNWGLLGLLKFNLVESLGLPSGVVSLVYILVGAAAIFTFITHMSDCKVCAKK